MLTTALILSLALAGPALAQAPADEAAVREVVRAYVDARIARDQTTVGNLFTADADQQTTTGGWRRGRAAITAGTLDSSNANPGVRRITVQTVRFVTPQVAVVDGPYTITSPAGQVRQMWSTLVVSKDGGGTWRIAAIRNSIPAGQ